MKEREIFFSEKESCSSILKFNNLTIAERSETATKLFENLSKCDVQKIKYKNKNRNKKRKKEKRKQRLRKSLFCIKIFILHKSYHQ